MKIIFLSSGNRGLSPVVKAQATSLQQSGVDVHLLTINKPGAWGYLSEIPRLRKAIRALNPSVIHAHYSFCGIIAATTGRIPVVCSLMGSDVKSSGLWRMVIRLFVKHIWTMTIVKSEDMKKSLGLDCAAVVPNGVDLDVFKPMDRDSCREILGWLKSKKQILFAADPDRREKNYNLANETIRLYDRKDVELKVVYGINHIEMPIYINASDLLLLTSLWEGSPNVVKEAMACNLPVVSTNVGDLKQLFDRIQGYLVTEPEPLRLSAAVKELLDSSEPTQGRVRLKELKLDSQSVAQQLENIYNNCIRDSR